METGALPILFALAAATLAACYGMHIVFAKALEENDSHTDDDFQENRAPLAHAQNTARDARYRAQDEYRRAQDEYRRAQDGYARARAEYTHSQGTHTSPRGTNRSRRTCTHSLFDSAS
jgi:hypothetical protein